MRTWGAAPGEGAGQPAAEATGLPGPFAVGSRAVLVGVLALIRSGMADSPGLAGRRPRTEVEGSRRCTQAGLDALPTEA